MGLLKFSVFICVVLPVNGFTSLDEFIPSFTWKAKNEETVLGSWAPWTQCSSTCGAGTRLRLRSCDGVMCARTEKQVEQCFSGNGAGSLAPWAPWTQCSGTCGSGTRLRSRSCDGVGCTGSDVEIEKCANGGFQSSKEDSWAPWAPWSKCSSTCGTGTRLRSRSCDGVGCVGKDAEVEKCGNEECQMNHYGSWAPWTQCSSTCGAGTRLRSRSCDAADCERDVMEVENCSGGECLNGQDGSWAPWAPWSSCSSTCGGGTRVRSRSCDRMNCDGEGIEIQKCSNAGYPNDQQDSWAPWAPWSQCSSTCGAGTRLRSRSCDGSGCVGNDAEAEKCSNGECQNSQTDSWAQWAPWSQCSSTCGSGTRLRSRSCDGSDCVGKNTEVTTCNAKQC